MKKKNVSQMYNRIVNFCSQLGVNVMGKCSKKSATPRQSATAPHLLEGNIAKPSQAIYLLPIFSAILLAMTRLPQSFDMFVFVAFVPLFHLFSFGSLRARNLILPASLFAITYLVICVHWISLVTFGGFLGILFLFSAVFSILFVIVAWMQRYKPICYHVAFIVIWICFEYACQYTEFRFPWFSVGYGLKNTLPLLQILEIGGQVGLSFMILLINLIFYKALTIKRMYFPLALVVLIVWYGIGAMWLSHLRKQTVEIDFVISMIQGSISQDEKWEYDMRDMTFDIYESLSREAVQRDKPDLIIFPEAALPVSLYRDSGYMRRLRAFVEEIDTPIFAGFPHFELERKYKGQDSPFLYYNAAKLFLPEGYKRRMPVARNIPVDYDEGIEIIALYQEAQTTVDDTYMISEPYGKRKDIRAYNPTEESYYKNILVPFGERIPFLNRVPILWKVQMGQANFESGEDTVIYELPTKKEVPQNYRILRFAPLICFEIAFPEYTRTVSMKESKLVITNSQMRSVASPFAHRVKRLPHFFVNITNDAWFYRSIGTHQHAVMAVFRTIETRMPVFRVANTGYTFYTTPDGSIHQMTELFDRTFVSTKLKLYKYDYSFIYDYTFFHKTFYVAVGYLAIYIFFLFFALQILHTFRNWLREILAKKR
jgi:apolipoprotein N-acyltransferase